MVLKSIFVGILFLFSFGVSFASEIGPVGWPGIPYRRPPARYEAVGCAYEESTAQSPLWFTVAGKTVGQIFYPSIDQPQIDSIEILITDGKSLFVDQKHDTDTTVRYLNDGATIQLSGESRLGLYHFEQLLVSDPSSATLRIHTSFTWKEPGLRVFVVFKPALNQSPSNLGLATQEALIATDVLAETPIYAALSASKPWIHASTGYLGFSDGWQELSQHFHLIRKWPQAGPGHLSLTGELAVDPGSHFEFDLTLSLGSSLSETLALNQIARETPFAITQIEYEKGWSTYLDRLKATSPVTQRILSESSEVARSTLLLKMHEDKIKRGTLVSSLGVPFINPRELYHQAMALLAAGDRVTPVHSFNYLKSLQNINGSWSSKYKLGGQPTGPARQYDQTAYPILLLKQLVDRGIFTTGIEEIRMVQRAAQFIEVHGPLSPEDRWGKKGGYLPQALASMISALRLSSSLSHAYPANRGKPRPSSDYHWQQTASKWQSSLEKWLLSPDHTYFLNNGSFLELVRMKLRDPKDPRILATLAAYLNPRTNLVALQNAEAGRAGQYFFGRFAEDQQKQGRTLWPELSGELGRYFVAAEQPENARRQLEALTDSTTEAGLIPQQVFQPAARKTGRARFQIGNEVACPWMPGHAETILLYRSIQEGIVFDAPKYSSK